MADTGEQFERGLALHDEKRYEEAVDAFTKALEENPSSGEGWFYKAQCLFELGRYKDSRECISKALEINPQHVEAMKLRFALAGKA